MQKRSVIIAGRHNTSITLEKEFMDELLSIASAQNQTINDLITEIDRTRTTPNLSSAVRIYILKYLKQQLSGQDWASNLTFPAKDYIKKNVRWGNTGRFFLTTKGVNPILTRFLS